jgi:hypothetical protein
MPSTRTLTIVVLALRSAYGAGLIAAPERLARRWLGPDAGRAPAQVPLRALGAREIVLHLLGLAATLRGGSPRPWLAASIAGDLSDVAATFAGRAELPEGAAPATAVVAGGSALLSGALVAALRRRGGAG